MDSVLRLKGVSKSYIQGNNEVHALKPTDLTIHSGELVGLVGMSGCGKSTLLHIAGLLQTPTNGEVLLRDTSCSDLRDNARTALRLRDLGFVYQFHHLLPELTVAENIAVPLILQKTPASQRQQRVQTMIEAVGLSDRAQHLPSELSGGQAQRVAIARALIHRPALLLADEPTGNLDPATATVIETLMIDTIRANHASALIVTHNMALAEKLDRVITL